MLLVTSYQQEKFCFLRKKENNKEVRFRLSLFDLTPKVYTYLLLQDKSVSLIFAAVFGRLKAQAQPQAHLGRFQRYQERARAQRGAH